SRKYWKMARDLPRKLITVPTQLRTGYMPLHAHLSKIGKVNSPTCPSCRKHPETVFHYLLQCTTHRLHRTRLRRKVGQRSMSLGTLLTERTMLKHLFRYVNETKRFHHILGDL
ncbi:hypothetical protein F5890DRAFT_1395129, partial [Lentinula detonsa]